MKIYKVFYKDGPEAKGLTIKISDHGKIKIVSNKELTLERLVRGGRIPKEPKEVKPYSGKPRGRPKKALVVTPPAEPGIAPETVTPGIPVEEQAQDTPKVSEAEDADIVNVGDQIVFTLNGEETNGEITKEYPDTQEMEVKIKGGLKLVIPAAWFIRKV